MEDRLRIRGVLCFETGSKSLDLTFGVAPAPGDLPDRLDQLRIPDGMQVGGVTTAAGRLGAVSRNVTGTQFPPRSLLSSSCRG